MAGKLKEVWISNKKTPCRKILQGVLVLRSLLLRGKIRQLEGHGQVVEQQVDIIGACSNGFTIYIRCTQKQMKPDHQTYCPGTM